MSKLCYFHIYLFKLICIWKLLKMYIFLTKCSFITSPNNMGKISDLDKSDFNNKLLINCYCIQLIEGEQNMKNVNILNFITI